MLSCSKNDVYRISNYVSSNSSESPSDEHIEDQHIYMQQEELIMKFK